MKDKAVAMAAPLIPNLGIIMKFKVKLENMIKKMKNVCHFGMFS